MNLDSSVSGGNPPTGHLDMATDIRLSKRAYNAICWLLHCFPASRRFISCVYLHVNSMSFYKNLSLIANGEGRYISSSKEEGKDKSEAIHVHAVKSYMWE